VIISIEYNMVGGNRGNQDVAPLFQVLNDFCYCIGKRFHFIFAYPVDFFGVYIKVMMRNNVPHNLQNDFFVIQKQPPFLYGLSKKDSFFPGVLQCQHADAVALPNPLLYARY